MDRLRLLDLRRPGSLPAAFPTTTIFPTRIYGRALVQFAIIMDASALSSEFIQVSFASPGVLHIQLNRAPLNAFNDRFWKAYGETFDGVAQGKAGDVRVIVVSSALEKHFTAGLDLVEATSSGVSSGSSSDPARRALYLKQHILEFQNAIGAPERCGVPVIAALHGTCFGLGIDISLACDVRYADVGTLFSIKEVDAGLAADIGTLARLRHAIGSASAFHELAYTARKFSASHAHSIGMVSKVTEGGRDGVLKAALGLAGEIAGKSPVAVATTKTFLLHARDHSVADALEYTAVWNASMLQAEDTTQAMMAIMKKRKPVFGPLVPNKVKL